MKRYMHAAAVLVILLLAAGCASDPKTHWKSRIGNFTSDEATLELGAPDRSVTLGDGSTESEWVTRMSSPDYWNVGFGPHYDAFWSGPDLAFGYPMGPASTDWLRLTFGPDGRLRSVAPYER